jgi:hypothetical protein
MTCTMAKTWNAPSMQLLTQLELTQLLSVMTSKRDKALLLLAYRHGWCWCLASQCEAFLRLRFTAYTACIPKHEITPQSLPREVNRTFQSKIGPLQGLFCGLLPWLW